MLPGQEVYWEGHGRLARAASATQIARNKYGEAIRRGEASASAWLSAARTNADNERAWGDEQLRAADSLMEGGKRLLSEVGLAPDVRVGQVTAPLEGKAGLAEVRRAMKEILVEMRQTRTALDEWALRRQQQRVVIICVLVAVAIGAGLLMLRQVQSARQAAAVVAATVAAVNAEATKAGRIAQAPPGMLLHTLIDGNLPVNSVAFSPDGQILATGSNDKKVRLWRVIDGELVGILGHSDRVVDVAFSPDGQHLITGAGDEIRQWQVNGGVSPRKINGEIEIESMAYSPDGQLVAAGAANGSVRVWRVDSGKLLHTVDHPYGVDSMAFSPDGQILAAVSSSTVYLLRADDGSLLRTIENVHGIHDIAFSPDGRIVATAGEHDVTVRLWQVSNGALLDELLFQSSYYGDVQSVAISPDGKLLAGGSYTSPKGFSLGLWEVENGTPHNQLQGQTQLPLSLAFSPDGQLLASGSRDGRVRIWKVADAP